MSIFTAHESIVAAHKAAVDNLQSLFNTALNSSEKIAGLHITTLRSGFADQLASGKRLLGARDLHEALSLHGSLLQAQVEKLIAYASSLYDISSDSQGELAKLLESQHAEFNKSVAAALDGYARSSGNSDLALAAVKSAISAANSAFAKANKAARQVADIADASVNAATSATVRAVGSSVALKKKAA